MESLVLSVVDWIHLWTPEKSAYAFAAIVGGSLLYLHVMAKTR